MSNVFNEFTNWPLIFFSVSSLVFLMLAVVGKSKFGFVEINPGAWGRLLALIIGMLCLMGAIGLIIFPIDILLPLIKNYLGDQLQKNIEFYTQFKPPS